MAYFIFLKNFDNISGSIYKIAENETDFENLNIVDESYKIIQDSQDNFDAVKYGTKDAISYNGNIITFEDATSVIKDKHVLKEYVDRFSRMIQHFLTNTPDDPQAQRWSDYKNQLSNLNLNSIEYPLNKSLEQYFKDQNQPSLNPLQLP
jgi:hypothetical protein